MKRLLAIIVLIAAGVLGWQYSTKPPDPNVQRAEAQQGGNKLIEFFLEMAKEDRLVDMLAVTEESRHGEVSQFMSELTDTEDVMEETLQEWNIMGMGGGGAVKVLMLGENSLLMTPQIRVEETDGTWWVVSVTDY